MNIIGWRWYFWAKWEEKQLTLTQHTSYFHHSFKYNKWIVILSSEIFKPLPVCSTSKYTIYHFIRQTNKLEAVDPINDIGICKLVSLKIKLYWRRVSTEHSNPDRNWTIAFMLQTKLDIQLIITTFPSFNSINIELNVMLSYQKFFTTFAGLS